MYGVTIQAVNKTASYVVRRSLVGHGEGAVELDSSGRVVGDHTAVAAAPKIRPQGGGTQNTPDEAVYATIAYVLVSGCAWRALPPCFGISKSTAHRRFVIRS